MELNDLPECTGSNKCANCGATNWDMARTDTEGNVTMCNKCEGVPSDWDPLKNEN